MTDRPTHICQHGTAAAFCHDRECRDLAPETTDRTAALEAALLELRSLYRREAGVRWRRDRRAWP